MTETIAVYGSRPTLCSAPDLVKALNLYSDFNIVSLFATTGPYKDRDNLARDEKSVIWSKATAKERKKIGRQFSDADHLILLGTSALKKIKTVNGFKRAKPWKSRAMIVGNGSLLDKPKHWNREFAKFDALYLMPDLYKYSMVDFIPYYPLFDSTRIEESTKDLDFSGTLTISHSPGKEAAQKRKGSRAIEKVISKLSKSYPIEWKPAYGIPYIDTLKIKQQSHIFIDQVVKNNPTFHSSELKDRYRGKIPYNGGLAKSGLEAMGLGCVTITTADIADNPYYPFPPAIFTDYNKFEDDLVSLFEDRENLASLSKIHKKWAREYVGLEFGGKHFTTHIRMENDGFYKHKSRF